MYLCKFNNEGYRTETLLSVEYNDGQKAEMLNNGYVEIDEEEWNYYVGNKGTGDNGTGYIRVDGKPVSAPAYVPTKEEKIQRLDNEYKHNYEELQKYFVQAVMNNDREIMEEIQQELQDLKTEYDVELAKINED